MSKVKKILISQDVSETGKVPYLDIATKHDLQIDFYPFIRVENLTAKEFRLQKINILDFTAIVFVGKTAVDHFFQLCEKLKIVVPDTMLYFCASESVALYLQKYIVYRKRKIHFGRTGKLEGLSASFEKFKKEKFLVPVSEGHVPNITDALDKLNLDYKKAVMYKMVSNEINKAKLEAYDLLLFFSPASVSALFEQVPEFKQENIYIGCFGASTAKSLKDADLNVHYEAPSKQFPSMTASLENFVQENHKKEKV